MVVCFYCIFFFGFFIEFNECLREDNCIFVDNGIDYYLKSFLSDC